MVSSRLVNKIVRRILPILTACLVFYNEFLIYFVKQSSWQQIECVTDNCTRILFIADPQLLGNTYDRSFYSGIAKFDADRYLKKTFDRSIAFTQPHIICFLGDLLDEGNVASPEDYKSYVQRFYNIYKINDNIRYVHVPGDNDIGGENGEYISNSNVRRFEDEFMQSDLFEYNNQLRFFKINRMLLDFTNPDREHNSDKVRVGLSHAPILIGGGPLLRSVLNDLDPHVIFTGHWHESRIYIFPSTKFISFYENEIKNFDLKLLKENEHSLLEIMVPTVSYRMGKTDMGIGYGVFDGYNLKYTVLWLPSRFICLFFYLFWIIFVMCILIVIKMMTSCPFRKRNSQYK